ncbi:NUDIX domain-containing protein [Thiomicrorhabdus indica]|uniref:NUDIX domain-containing protein n=1 Tax=Thiomicrorhabdus indica TaxID=2267253 RepID=UPI0013EE57E4|nr:NUDIX hydrolase [Thiomicrorhabdus indica]
MKSLKIFQINKLVTLYSGFFSYLKLDVSHSLYHKDPSKPQEFSEELHREVMSRGDAIAVLLFNLECKELLLVEQFRAGAMVSIHLNQQTTSQSDAWLVEPVAGCIDQGESPIEAVKREALEEAGVKVTNIHKLACYYPSPAACDERIFLYAAEYDSCHNQRYGGVAAENEDIAVVKLSFKEAKMMLEQQSFNVSTTIMSLQWFFNRYSNFI